MGESNIVLKKIENSDPRRRDFLRAFGSGAVGFAIGGFSGCGGAESEGIPAEDAESYSYALTMDEDYWRATSGLFENHGSVLQFNIDVGAVRPAVTLNKFKALGASNASTLGGYTAFIAERDLLAASFGLKRHSLALTRTASDSMRHVLFGLQWKAGDVVVTTTQEQPTTNFYLGLLESEYKIKCVYVDTRPLIRDNSISAVEVFENKIKGLKAKGINVRALLWSSPSHQNGMLLPMRGLANIARKHNIISICDASHLIGMAHFSFSKENVDFLCGSEHKWQCGVNTTGLLFIGDRAIDGDLIISTKLQDSIIEKYDITINDADYEGSLADRLSIGHSKRAGMYEAFIESCNIWDSIGRSKIQAQIFTLNRYLRREINKQWDSDSLQLTLNDKSELSSGIICLNPFQNPRDIESKQKSDAFVANLRDRYGIQVRQVEAKDQTSMKSSFPLRISTPIWITIADIDRLVAGMTQLSHEMA